MTLLTATPIHMSLSSSDHGDLVLVVPDASRYIAHVPYQTGKLTLYLPKVQGKRKLAGTYLLFVITDVYNPSLDFMGWTWHDDGVDEDTLIREALEGISVFYLGRLQAVTNTGVADGTITVQ